MKPTRLEILKAYSAWACKRLGEGASIKDVYQESKQREQLAYDVCNALGIAVPQQSLSPVISWALSEGLVFLATTVAGASLGGNPLVDLASSLLARALLSALNGESFNKEFKGEFIGWLAGTVASLPTEGIYDYLSGITAGTLAGKTYQEVESGKTPIQALMTVLAMSCTSEQQAFEVAGLYIWMMCKVVPHT